MSSAARALIVLMLTATTLIGCSPEALRARGSGPGADVGNRGTAVEIHGTVDPAYRTPRVGQAILK